MRLGRIGTGKGLLPLPLAGEGWGGGAAAIHAVRVERVSPTRIASFDAMRPPPQAGEVRQVRGQADSTKNHPAIDDSAIHLLFWRVRLAKIDGYAGSIPRMTSSSALRCVRDAGKR